MEEVVKVEDTVEVEEVVRDVVVDSVGVKDAILVLTELEVAGLPIPWAISSFTEKEAITGTAKAPPITIFLRIARREGSTDANTRSSFPSLIAFYPLTRD